jgi:formylmethanofuran dehydrogenase subunit E
MKTETTPIEVQEAWLRQARVQGLVCQICHEPPRYDERHNFFDTGVCVHCATDKSKASPLTA